MKPERGIWHFWNTELYDVTSIKERERKRNNTSCLHLVLYHPTLSELDLYPRAISGSASFKDSWHAITLTHYHFFLKFSFLIFLPISTQSLLLSAETRHDLHQEFPACIHTQCFPPKPSNIGLNCLMISAFPTISKTGTISPCH